MFALFFSLYYSMFSGTWNNYSYGDLFSTGYTKNILASGLNAIGKLITSIINEGVTYDSLGTNLFENGTIMYIVAFVLSLITSIGIVVMAVKGVKKAFGIFFMGIRRW